MLNNELVLEIMKKSLSLVEKNCRRRPDSEMNEEFHF